MNKRFLLMLTIFLPVFFVGEEVFADSYWGTGGSSVTGGVSSGNPVTHYDCYSMPMCPHWIRTTIEDFSSIISDKRYTGSYSDFSVCTDSSINTDGYVVFSGKSYNGLYYLHNFLVEKVNPTKSSHTYLEPSNLLSMSMQDPADMTYGELLNEILGRSGLPESQIAFFCGGMLAEDDPSEPEPEPDPEPDPDPVVPESPCGSSTTVNVEQKNSSNKKVYNTWTSSLIYAKPEDTIEYAYSYCAGVQSQAFDTVTTRDGGHGCSDSTNTNMDFSAAIAWNNFYKISQPGKNWQKDYAIGSIVSATDDGSYTIVSNDVGNTLSSTITSSSPSSASSSNDGVHTWSIVCSYDCECGNCSGSEDENCQDSCNCACEPEEHEHTNNYYSYSYSGPVSETVQVRIPYNYILTDGSVTIGSEVVYAGETISLEDASVMVSPKYSNTLLETYATKTQSATATLYALWFSNTASYGGGNVQGSDFCSYYENSGQCVAIENLTTSRELNKDSNLSGTSESFFSGTYAVFDIPAGYKMCLGFEVSLAESSSNPDSNSSNGNKYISTIECRTIAKKPTFQVWGGSIYLNGSTTLFAADKNNLYNNFASYNATGYGYSGKSTTPVRRFGSWVELSIAAADGVNVGNLASGAAAGYSKRAEESCSIREDWRYVDCFDANPGGAKSLIDSYDHLTIPNDSFGTAPDKDAESSIKTNILSENIDASQAKTVSNSVDLSDTSSYNSPVKTDAKEVRRTHSNGNLTISASTALPQKTTHIISVDGDLTIASNLIYDQSTYVSSSQIPQYIIYAKGDINISCSVAEIDAILISDETIYTCADAGGDDDRARSTQLKIKGALIADKLTLGRTYGASVGKYSEEPAEIIDADPTTYLWGMNEATETPTLTTTYLRELAPRY